MGWCQGLVSGFPPGVGWGPCHTAARLEHPPVGSHSPPPPAAAAPDLLPQQTSLPHAHLCLCFPRSPAGRELGHACGLRAPHHSIAHNVPSLGEDELRKASSWLPQGWTLARVFRSQFRALFLCPQQSNVLPTLSLLEAESLENTEVCQKVMRRGFHFLSAKLRAVNQNKTSLITNIRDPITAPEQTLFTNRNRELATKTLLQGQRQIPSTHQFLLDEVSAQACSPEMGSQIHHSVFASPKAVSGQNQAKCPAILFLIQSQMLCSIKKNVFT